ncbi:MAG: undecaprenyl-phosphate glucose phosphotransferase [Defluviitaleaceae bacterium]|nr:undecaprenyl-phosphate glucose phosphotransferase [Defluviitaleaceae bacterium]
MKREWRLYSIVVLLLDILSIVLANLLSVWVRFNVGVFPDIAFLGEPSSYYYSIVFIMIPVFVVVSAAFKLYKATLKNEASKEFGKIVGTNLLSALLLVGFTFVFRWGLEYSRWVLFFFVAFNIIFTTIFRNCYRAYMRSHYKKGHYQRRIAVVGINRLAEAYISSVKAYRRWGYRMEGIILTEASDKYTGFMGYKVLGSIDELPELNKEYAFDEIIIALNSDEISLLTKIIKICDLEGIRVKIVPVYYELLNVSTNIEDVDGMSLMVIRDIPLDSFFNRFLKRAFDIAFSSAALLFFSPLLIMVAIGVRMSSPGPIFFKQERVGQNGKTFNMLKFRSMRVQTDEEEQTQWTTQNDPRKTKFGTLIRKTSLDELPQFINVFLGNMSVVGPRPERPYWVEKFKSEIPEYMLRHYVKAGITGWAQVNGWRGDTSIKERIKCDNYYIQNWDLMLDIKICILTLVGAFTDKNAY